jgi:hypothetical protein
LLGISTYSSKSSPAIASSLGSTSKSDFGRPLTRHGLICAGTNGARAG